ncbi:MAG: class I SAM-dependent rRNA methyltransferase [Methylomonas sp.]|nr:class I SAM-dependent rRNA methyltransferase [Methylomonas sp.]PPD20870.1 MAG: RlmI/RlmK family 23S rRNA methyltransferase [Methylomonas sp.]PPD26341.1 MAG: RlmI/RlmK family 23S rRNA methyltransferase [Methylomonas sp.]PPD38062.1 MAG: RlmI/RlmK family 23S rRNA methyltransferase [Methylomonas sp.]PPD40301.1 MAG: RlmI/RlmK family 23S rRNA methyltransferase [Methylomonas sp.]
MNLPELFLKKHEDKRLRNGHLWVFSNEIDSHRSPLEQFGAGDLASLHDHTGKPLGIVYVNPATLICARLLTRKPNSAIGKTFFKNRLTQALNLRNRLFAQPFYRLVFGESDGLPGLVIDRFGDVLSLQITTAGMERLKPLLIDVLIELLTPAAILLKNDSSQRQLENLVREPEVVHGKLPQTIVVEENGARFITDIAQGQKTGWFYDHRCSRAQLAAWAKGMTVLDLFSYAGAWGITAALGGAETVVCVDSSESALALAKESAAFNGVADRVQFVRSDVFDFLKQAREAQQRFDAVVLDPPALIKRKKDYKNGYEAYRRLNHLALQVMESDGLLVSASCSHHLQRDDLHEILRSSARHIDRHLVFIAEAGQGPDHPIHPAMPETEYLKTFFCSVSACM